MLVSAIQPRQYLRYLNRLESKKDCDCAKKSLKEGAKWTDHAKFGMEKVCRQRYEAEFCREDFPNLQTFTLLKIVSDVAVESRRNVELATTTAN